MVHNRCAWVTVLLVLCSLFVPTVGFAAGSLTVTIAPQAAIDAGANWRVDGGAWQASGATVAGLTAGSHTVSFSAIASWNTPANKTVAITDSQTTEEVGRYVPNSFSLQSYMTPAKNQGGCETCWIFAAIGGLEALVSISTNGTIQPDYSEMNVKNCHQNLDAGANRCTDRGTSWNATGHLGLRGAVLEADDPYVNPTTDFVCDTGLTIQVFPMEFGLIPASGVALPPAVAPPATTAAIKEALYYKGVPINNALYNASVYAAGAAFHHGDPAVCGASSDNATHNILIVGYDDSYPRACGGTGAWLVKNSYGTGYGDNGYFWIGYDQARIGTDSSFYSAYRTQYAGEVIRHYDEGCNNESQGYAVSNYGVVKFTADRDEVIRRVDFFTAKGFSTYEITIATSMSTKPGLVPAGVLGVQTGSIEYAGFYSIELATPINISNGTSYYVYVSTQTDIAKFGSIGSGFYFDQARLGTFPAGVCWYAFGSASNPIWMDAASTVFPQYNKGPLIFHAITTPAAAGSTWYKDADGDGYSDGTTTVAVDRPAGYKLASELTATSGDCNDNNAAVHPGAVEVCNGTDDNCNGQTDEGVTTTYYQDADGDGYGNPAVSTQACSAPVGYVTNNTDCNDADAAIHPGAAEVCNGKDDNCNGQVDEGLTTTYYQDADGDGYGNPAVSTQACSAPVGYVTNNTDCNDADAAIHPGAAEVCNGKDDNCNGQTDEGAGTTYYQDSDGDGYGNPAVSTQACSQPAGYVANNTDCNDSDPKEHPGQTWYKDADGDGYSDGSTTTACARPAGYKVSSELTATSGDCNDGDAAIHPGAAEVCNGKDDNCNGQVDEGLPKNAYYMDLDGDGYGDAKYTIQACSQPAGYVTNNTDCNDADAAVHPGAAESCNGKDDNCNGQVDEGLPKNAYYMDLDGDGYGDAKYMIQACSQPAGYVTNNTDCDDTNAAVHPGATEVCNGKDDNCNGQVDEGFPKKTYYMDMDGDGYGDARYIIQACAQPQGYVSNHLDCDDTKTAVYPGAQEVCDNGIDDDCNGLVDQDDPACGCSERSAYHFKPGWNLITLTCMPEEPYTAKTLAEAINSAGGVITKLMRWDNGAWNSYSVGAPFGDFTLEIGQGYLVQAEQASDWCHNCPAQGCLSYTLHSGWNLLGFPTSDGLTAMNLLQICNSENGNVTRILRWDGGSWRSYSAGSPFGDFDILPKEGYFVLSMKESTFNICPLSVSSEKVIQIPLSWANEIAEVAQVNDRTMILLSQTAYDEGDQPVQATIHFAGAAALRPCFNHSYEKSALEAGGYDNRGGNAKDSIAPLIVPSLNAVLPAERVMEKNGATPSKVR